MIPLTKDKRMLGFRLLSACPDISHFVTTRYGGCGEGAYGTFNCSPFCGDDEENVRKNQRLLLDALPVQPAELVIPRQVHGSTCMVISDRYHFASPDEKKEMLEGVDALITVLPGYCLCVSTADCVPVMLYHKKKNLVGSIHAGWRGTLESITFWTLTALKENYDLYPEDFIACIGPSISLESYEVGEEVYEAFRKKNFNLDSIFVWNKPTRKHHLDLWRANELQLLEAGVPIAQIEVAGICTYIRHEEFFSARRLGIQSGRILSGIMLTKKTTYQMPRFI